ncbi:hypothetical protein Hdeb2414_s0020g00567881 [Helianthus debilis subsp. tardiflorus]
MVVTTHEGVLEEFHGAKLVGSRSFSFPWYQHVPLSLALSPRIINEVKQFKLDIIHASSPGIMFLHQAADLTLVPSTAISKDLQQYKVAACNYIYVDELNFLMPCTK